MLSLVSHVFFPYVLPSLDVWLTAERADASSHLDDFSKPVKTASPDQFGCEYDWLQINSDEWRATRMPDESNIDETRTAMITWSWMHHGGAANMVVSEILDASIRY